MEEMKRKIVTHTHNGTGGLTEQSTSSQKDISMSASSFFSRWLRPYWRQFLLLFMLGVSSALSGWGANTLYAGLIWFGVIIIVDIVIVWKTRDYWLWPAVRMIEVNWYGRTLDKEGTTEAERKEWKKKNRFMVGRKD